MAADDLGLLVRDADHFSSLGSHIFVAGAVETVTTDFLFGITLVRKRIQESFGGHSLMEGGVEDAHVLDVREQFLHHVDAEQRGGVVQGRQFAKLGDLLALFVADDHTAVEILAAVRHTMTHRVDFVQGLDDTVHRVGQSLEHQPHAHFVVGNGGLHVIFVLAHGLVGELTHLQTDAFNKTFGQQFRLRLHFQKLILDGGAATI